MKASSIAAPDTRSIPDIMLTSERRVSFEAYKVQAAHVTVKLLQTERQLAVKD
jgi:hypothetical protein